MRKGLLTMLCLLLTMCLHADPISKEQAHETARAFLAGKGITMTTDATPAYKARRRSAAAEVAGYYIFNAGGDRGYVMAATGDLSSCRATTARRLSSAILTAESSTRLPLRRA
ncbi:peptidase C10 family protein [Prevotella sp. CAG:487]|nr:peptidase C10 family protein [Prevotella sp. CAG:487]